MIIAAPLLVPFATAVGLPIAGLGAIEIGKKVQDFVDNNPEVSMEILTSLKDSLLITAPGGIGLNTLFKKKAKEDSDDESVEVAPEDRTKEERAKEMKKRFKEGKGDKREIGKKAYEEVIKPVKDIEDLLEGDKRYDGSLEDAPTPKFDFTKFYKNRRRNADGGAIGIEVLFEEKKDGGRIGFANGGENIIGADLKDPETEFSLRPNTDDRMPLALAVMPEKVRNVFDVASEYNAAKGLTGDTSGGYLSNLRHGTAASQMRDALGGGVTGIIGANVLGLAQELPGLSLGAVNEVRELFGGPKHSFMNTLNQTGEDIYANLYGSLYGKEGTTAETYADLADKFATDTGFINTSLNATADKQNALNQSGLYQAISNYGTAAAADFRDGEMLQTPGVMVDANDGFRTSPRTNVEGMDLEEDLGARINPDIQPSLNMFQRAGNFIGELDLEDYIPFIGERSLTRKLGQGVGNLFRGIAPARYGTSQRVYNALSPQGRSAVGSIYGPGGIMQGYNPVSAFGRGAIGAIDNRISNIQNRRAPQTYASQQKIKDLFEARNKIAGVSMEDRTYTGFGKTGMGRDTSVQMSGKAPSRGRDRDVQMSGSSSGGGSSKIVCTMMNESYGFGNFRNKIWLKHSRNLPKEYEIGYHTIFLPLVKFAKGEGKLNKVVKKTLEHIARHRTLDLKQEMKGKTHALGRVYRKILEPICLMVGKIKKAVK